MRRPLDKKTKIQIIVFIVDIVISVILVLLNVFLDDTALTIGGRMALLSANIVTLIGALQFSMGLFFNNQKEEIEKVNTNLTKSVNEIEGIIEIEEVYLKVYKLNDKMQSQYKKSIFSFLKKISNCIDEKRSGALDIMEYYNVLDGVANDIKKDKQDVQGEYAGGIWALTFCLDDEWDDSSPHERSWFEVMKEMDKSGIITNRLWVFDKKVLDLLKRETLEENSKQLLQRLKMYCSKDTDFKNTKSYAIAKETILDDHVRLFGKGFFATTHADGKSQLIRGVCFDNLLSQNSLGGEIDFDETRIRQIKKEWDNYMRLGKNDPLDKFIYNNGSVAAKEYMKQLDYAVANE